MLILRCWLPYYHDISAMNKSDKIELIKKITAKLSSEGSGIIDLTLKQYKIPVLQEFNGNTFDYVLQRVQLGDDDNILELGNHLKIDLQTTDPDISPSFWRDGYLNLFISHLASDKNNAQSLKNELEKYSISGFVAHSDIEPTKEWQDEIELALRTSDALVALMIPGFHDSKWTDQEIGLALGRDLLIIPVRMGQDPYGFIGKFQAIRFQDTASLSLEIFESLLKNKKTSKKMTNAIMYLFENSGSFALAKNNMSLVEKIEYWDKNLIERLIAAKRNNSQIEDSFGVKGRLNRIVYDFKNQNRVEK